VEDRSHRHVGHDDSPSPGPVAASALA
jgi:hypothetical protein